MLTQLSAQPGGRPRPLTRDLPESETPPTRQTRESQPEGRQAVTSQTDRCPGGTLDHLPTRPVSLIQVGGSVCARPG
jgi:hypothetical protein